ncbi:serine/threonine-protein kinase [Streptomyces sp. NRRL F-4474]|uniref:serine/threonine-protein kinase n=1 Tax=Streptomyces sp. NRRL F-4474 TaxID=1463851 RepID=UPI0004C50288|nr:serine/threonine-protein kinase [Streptomyces sp. NRRL F-4474]
MEQVGPGGPMHVGPFEVVGVLGQGGMGRVLLAAGPDGRLVAVKQVLAHFADDAGFRARFRREVTASRKVSAAYTAAVIDADPDAPTPWLASVFVAGPSLGAVVKAVGVLPEDVVRRLAAGLTSALAEIHRAGLVHRDLKPDNVLLAEDGVRVIDLGIARATEGEPDGDTGLTRTGFVVGSPAYMSPEQAEGKPLTPASDVFSLGSVLVMALTGRSPFAGSCTLKTLYEVAHGEPDLSVVPAGLRDLVARCLAKDPEARPSPAELRELIGPVAPAGRQWPSAVYGMLAEQRARIDGLLACRPAAGGAPEAGSISHPVHVPDTTRVPEPESAPESAPIPVSAPVLLPEGGPAAAPEQDPQAPTPKAPLPAVPLEESRPGGPPRARRRRVAALVAAGVLLVAGTGGALYVRDRMNAPIGYTALPDCREAREKLSLDLRPSTADTWSGTADGVQKTCNGGGGTAASPTAVVRWDLSLGGNADADVSARRRHFQSEAAGQRAASRLGFGTEAYWESAGPDWTCAPAVREGNLSVRVGLKATPYAKGACETKAKEAARAALKAAQR